MCSSAVAACADPVALNLWHPVAAVTEHSHDTMENFLDMGRFPHVDTGYLGDGHRGSEPSPARK